MQNRIRLGLGCFTLVVIVLVFSIEATLALLRQRNLNVTLEVNSAVQATTPQATPDVTVTVAPTAGGTPQAKTAVLAIDPSATLIIHVTWDYRIGPRFPDTLVHAQVTDHFNQIVAFSENTVLCGTESIHCSGEFPLTLNYSVKGDLGSRQNWPPDTYTLVVTSGIADLKPTEKLRQQFTIQELP